MTNQVRRICRLVWVLGFGFWVELAAPLQFGFGVWSPSHFGSSPSHFGSSHFAAMELYLRLWKLIRYLLARTPELYWQLSEIERQSCINDSGFGMDEHGSQEPGAVFVNMTNQVCRICRSHVCDSHVCVQADGLRMSGFLGGVVWQLVGELATVGTQGWNSLIEP